MDKTCKLLLTVAVSAISLPTYATAMTESQAHALVSESCASVNWTDQQFAELRVAASHGDPAALGGMALWNGVCRRDPRASFKYARLGAARGDPLAEDLVGEFYSGGGGEGIVPKSPGSAAHWFLLSARQGSAQGETDLGLSFLHGQGVPPNPHTAAHWLRKGAMGGNPQAETYLGLMYIQGVGVPPNQQQGMIWMHRAAAIGYQPAIAYLKQHPQTQALATAPSVSSPPTATPGKPAAAPPAAPVVVPAAAAVADSQQALQNLASFWRLYFQRSNAHLMAFGEPALVQPVTYGGSAP